VTDAAASSGVNRQNTALGIWLMVATSLVFSAQDGFSRHLAASYNVWMVVMIRYWFFAAFVTALAARAPGGLRQAVAARFPKLQVFRGVLLALEICLNVTGFVLIGLVESHAVFACYPLLVAALSGPVLGERVGWRRWTAIAVGFVGVLVILEPGVKAVSPLSVIPLGAAFMFALYALLTRYVARGDTPSVSFFWTGVGGAVVMTLIGVWHWQPMSPPDWGWMAALCLCGALGHFLMIKAFAVAEASAIQPFAYLQLVFASGVGIVVFGDAIEANVVAGAGIVVAAGVFTLWRARVAGAAAAKAAPSARR
jgi:drug/metabolite transporter (DMT)-like permease